MKTIFSLITCLGFTWAAHAAISDKVILSGKIKKPNNDSLFVEDEAGQVFRSLRLGKSGTFRDTMQLKPGIYHLNDGTEFATLWLKPGFDLQISIDTRRFDETVSFKGAGSAENNYLAGRYLLEEKLESKTSYAYYARLNESGFLSFMDSLQTVRLNFLNKHNKGMDPGFYSLQKMVIDYDKMSNMYSYESMHGYMTGKPDFRVSEQYPDPFKGIELNRGEWAASWEYTNVVSDYLYAITGRDSAIKQGQDYYLVYMKHLDLRVTSPGIRNKLASDVGMSRLGYSKSKDSVYNAVMGMVSDTADRARISDLYAKLKKLHKGAVSQTFSFADRSGKLHTLEDFRGKLVYIDVWATWCGPCIGEMPSLAALQDSLKGKDIVFVSICKSDLRNSWERFLDKKKPEGVQLFAEDNDAAFFKDYVVQGIPRFILIDREGRIIDADAKRPSDARLKTELLDLLK